MMKWEQKGSLRIGRFTELERFHGVMAVFSTRVGGYSEGPFFSLNLGMKTPDDPARVRANRELFFRTIGISEAQTVRPAQTHSANCVYAQIPGRYECTDASFTDRKEVYLTITASDCVPVLFYEPHKQIIGAIHAGWRGSAQRIVYHTIMQMLNVFQTRPDDVVACIGPSICGACYEVSEEVAHQFAGEFIHRSNGSKPHLDLWAVNAQQLREAGVRCIVFSELCTLERQDLFFSHRGGGGVSGRMLGVIGQIKE